MRAKAVAERILELVERHGDRELFLDVGPDGLIAVGDIDVDTEDTGIIVWARSKEFEPGDEIEVVSGPFYRFRGVVRFITPNGFVRTDVNVFESIIQADFLPIHLTKVQGV